MRLLAAGVVLVVSGVLLLPSSADAHEVPRPRSLAPVVLAMPDQLPADAQLSFRVLRDLEWANRGPHNLPLVRVPARSSGGSAATLPPGVPYWVVDVVATYFPEHKVAEGVRVIECETGGTYDPSIPNRADGRALGLWQFLPQWGDGTWTNPYGPFDRTDPWASTRVAAWLSKSGEDWGHWECKPW